MKRIGFIITVSFFLGVSSGRCAAEISTEKTIPIPRWQFDNEGGLYCELPSPDHYDAVRHVELVTHGRRVIMRIYFPVDDGKATLVHGPQVQWPIFKSDVRDKDMEIPHTETRSTDLPVIRINDKPYELGRRTSYRYNGFFQVVYDSHQGIKATRTLFPSIEGRLALQEWRLENTEAEPVTVQVPSTCETLWKRTGADGQNWLIDYIITPVTRQRLLPGETAAFAVAYAAYPESEVLLPIDLHAEKQAYLDLIHYADKHLVLQTPDRLLNRAFHFAKIRTLLSNIETKAGILNTTGSMAYYCGFWANDNAEYASPFIPLLGHTDLLNGVDTMYRVWLNDIQQYTLKDKQITGSFESYNLFPYQRGRGDEAMILYGLSHYLLALGDRQRAEEMWPLVERCADYLRANCNESGVIASRTDELEGRLPTGNANLSTSALGYGGLDKAARLAGALGKSTLAQEYRQFAESLETSIETYFGRTVEGYDTYSYYEGNDLLRGWISLPLVVGIDRRKEQTLDALFSTKLWLEKPETDEVNLKAVSTETETRWGRETYYALLAAYKAGRTELATEKLSTVLRSHILGPRGPFADEDAIDLLAPTILFGRVVTEGLFGIEPWNFNGFCCSPRLPKSWPWMKLNQVSMLGKFLDMEVSRSGDDIQLTVREREKLLYSQRGPVGTAFKVIVSSSGK